MRTRKIFMAGAIALLIGCANDPTSPRVPEEPPPPTTETPSTGIAGQRAATAP